MAFSETLRKSPEESFLMKKLESERISYKRLIFKSGFIENLNSTSILLAAFGIYCSIVQGLSLEFDTAGANH